MRTIITTILLLPLLLTTGLTAKAQADPHFSQYYVYPSWLNPALTGAFDGNYRLAAIYRNQWGNISNPFSTYGVAADFTTNKQFNFGACVNDSRHRKHRGTTRHRESLTSRRRRQIPNGSCSSAADTCPDFGRSE